MSSNGIDVNPLQRMLGVFLRVERTRLGYSSQDVARRLGLSDSYFRLVEAGRAALSQGLVFRIIDTFAAINTQTQVRGINFSRLAIFLVGIHWVGSEMAAHKEGKASGKRAVETLASLVDDFQRFYDATKRYFSFEEGADDQKQFLEDVAAPEVRDFLLYEPEARAVEAGGDYMR